MADPVYTWAPDSSRMRATSLVPYAGTGLLLPLWPNGSKLWTYNGSTLTSATVSLGANNGFTAAVSDGASGAWVVQSSGSLMHYPASSGVAASGYPLPGNQVYVGCAYIPSFVTPYVLSAAGEIYAGIGANPIGGYGQAATCFAVSGQTLFSLVSGNLGIFALTGATTGTLTFNPYPMVEGYCLAASSAASAVAVGGWSYVTFATGYTQMAFSPANAVMIALNGSTNIDIYQGPNENWSKTSTVAVTGHPAFGAWNSSGTTVITTDPTAGQINVYGYSLGNLTLNQSLLLTNASALSITPDNQKFLVCQPLFNQVTPYTLSGGTWVSGAAVALSSPSCVLATAATSAVVGGNASVDFLVYSGGVWNLAGAASLPYTPVGLATASGNIFACGSQGSLGYFSAVSGNFSTLFNYAWTGSANGIFYLQGQIWVVDKTDTEIWAFGNLFSQYLNIFNFPSTQPFGNIAVSLFTQFSNGGTVFGMASGSTSLYQLTSPYNIEPLRQGVVSIYTSGAWNSASLGSGQTPTALTFDPSGNVMCATLQNTLYQISSAGVILQTATVTQFSGQPQTTPLGMSALAYLGSGLYAATSLAGTLIRVSG
jgi:hypothetical protein